MVGQLVGNYRIVSELAVGGMGTVYVAEHKHIGKRAAIKLLLPALSKKQEVIARFFDEARAASHVDHPGIVQIFDCDYYAPTGQAYLVMELLQGVTLRQRMAARQGPMDEAWSVGTALGVAEPLSAAHAKGIVHRDLKPENIFLARGAVEGKETVKLLDFGVAKLGASLRGNSTSTLEGSILGTPLYMSPEQCRGDRSLDSRADTYSLGCVLFEMLCGRPPFVGDNPTALISAHLCEAPPDPRAFAPSLSSELAALVRSMLAKDAGARPASIDLVIHSLSNLGNSEGSYVSQPWSPSTTRILPAGGEVAPRGVSTTMLATPPQSTTLSQTAAERLPGPVGPIPAGSRRALFLGTAIAVVATVGVAVVVVAGGDGSASAPPSATRPIAPRPPEQSDQPNGAADRRRSSERLPEDVDASAAPPPAAAVAPSSRPLPSTLPRRRRDLGARGLTSVGGAGGGVNRSKITAPIARPPERLPIE